MRTCKRLRVDLYVAVTAIIVRSFQASAPICSGRSDDTGELVKVAKADRCSLHDGMYRTVFRDSIGDATVNAIRFKKTWRPVYRYSVRPTAEACFREGWRQASPASTLNDRGL